jgi:uncharacterized protein (DUF1684 family)
MTLDTSAYVGEIKSWQTEMEDRLRAPDGWLTLVGLDWLDKGSNTIGTALTNKIVLPEGTAPEKVGTLTLENGQVSFAVEEGVDASLNSNPITNQVLESDINRNPDIVYVGEVNFHVIERGTRLGIRTKQTNSPLRVNFSGRGWWLIDKDFRVKAEIIPYAPQKMVNIPDVLGDVQETAMDCQLKFQFQRKEYTLDAFALPSGQYYILFHDLSCGSGSYPSGRFLVTETPEDDHVFIDFNKAHNPPCAFTPFATCPLPPEQNYLPLKIQAGERYVEIPGHTH